MFRSLKTLKKVAATTIASVAGLSIIAAPAYALADKDVWFTQWDQGQFSQILYFLQPPGGGVSAFYGMNGSTEHPDQFLFGTGLNLDIGTKTLNVVSVPTSSVTGLDALFASKANAVHSHVISDVTGLQTALDGKYAQPAGTTAQYIRGDGSLATFPSAGTVTSVAMSSSDLSVSGSPITSSGTFTVNLNTSGITAGTYSSLTVNNKGIATTGTTRVFNNNVSRSLNSNYTISSTRDARVSYSINASWTLNALLSGSGTAFLEYSMNGGTNWTTVNQVGKSLNLLTVAGGDDMNLVGDIPAGGLVRIRTTSSNMTVSYVLGQEILQ